MKMKTKIRQLTMGFVVAAMLAIGAGMAVSAPPPPGGETAGRGIQGPPPNVTQLRYSEEEIKAALEFVKNNDPTFYEELLNIQKNLPGEFNIIIGETVERNRDLERLKKESPEEYNDVMLILDYEKRERDLSRQYREAASAEEKSRIETELTGVLKELFDLNLKQRQRELQRLEKELKNIKDEIEKRKTNKDKIIKNRFDEVTGKNDYLRW